MKKRWPKLLLGAFVVLSGCDHHHREEYRHIDQAKETSSSVRDIDSEGESIQGAADVSCDGQQPSGAMWKTPASEVVATEDSQSPISALAISNPRKIELLVPVKRFPVDRTTGALRVMFDDLNLLNVLNMEPITDDAVSLMPEWMTSLPGQTIRIRGFMLPPYQAEGLETFVLLRDNQECCYGPGAKIYDHIQVEMKTGTTASDISLSQSLDVVGRFKIDLQSANGSVFGLYVIEDASIISR